MSSSASDIKQSKQSGSKTKAKPRTSGKKSESRFKQEPKKKSLGTDKYGSSVKSSSIKSSSLKSSSGKTTSEEGGRRKEGRRKESKDKVKSLILQSIEKTDGKESPTSGVTILYKVSGDKIESVASYDPYVPTLKKDRKTTLPPRAKEPSRTGRKKHRLMTRAEALYQNQRVIVKNEAFKLNEYLTESTEEVEFSSALFEDSFDDIARKNEQALRQKLRKDLKSKKIKKEVEAKPEKKEQEPSIATTELKATDEGKSKETSKHSSKEAQESAKKSASLEKTPTLEETKEGSTLAAPAPAPAKEVPSESQVISETPGESVVRAKAVEKKVKPSMVSQTLTFEEKQEESITREYPGKSGIVAKSTKPSKLATAAVTKPGQVPKKREGAQVRLVESKKSSEQVETRASSLPTSAGEPAEHREQKKPSKKRLAEPAPLAKKESSQIFFVPKKKSIERPPARKRSKRLPRFISPYSPFYIRPAESVSSSSVTSDERGRPHPSGLSFSSFCFLYQHYQAVSEELACCCETKLSLAELQSRSCRELCERDAERRKVQHPTGLTFSEYRVVLS